MGGITFGYGVPMRQNQPAPASTNWTKIYDERIAYGSETATFIPALDPGAYFTGIILRSVAAGGSGDGHNFQVAFNSASAPSFGYEVGSTSGADLAIAPGMIHNIWVKMVDASDVLDFIGLG